MCCIPPSVIVPSPSHRNTDIVIGSSKAENQSRDPTSDCKTHSTAKDHSASRQVTFYRQTCLYRYSCPARMASPYVELRNVQFTKLVCTGRSVSPIRDIFAYFCWLQGGIKAFHWLD